MRVLLLNQTFHPDVVATSLYLTPLAVALAQRGHDVRVIAGQRAYDDPQKLFRARETWNGIEIYRIRSTGFGKGAKWRRVADFTTFKFSCLWQVATLPRADVVVALTSPPLISFLGAASARLLRGRFVYWVMDMNPDAAIAAGWLQPNSLAARGLEWISHFSFREASKVIALDRFMAGRIAAKGIPDSKIEIIPPWSHDGSVRFDSAGRERFRFEHDLTDKFVVMYSGNHSPCHPLTTLLAAAKELANDARFTFLFVGGGSELPKVKQFAGEHRLSNIRCLPYQPAATLAASLSAADLHVVVMGDPFVGMIHPCKIYNILAVGAPILYIGPNPSHVTDILSCMDAVTDASPRSWYAVAHGDTRCLIQHLRDAAEQRTRGAASLYQATIARFSEGVLLPRLVALLETLGR